MKNEKLKISEGVFIPLYIAGKSPFELSKIFKCGQRTIENYESRLRSQNKIPYRKDLGENKKEKVRHSNQEIFEEVQVYTDNAKGVLENTKDLYTNIPLISKWGKNKQKEDMVLVWSDMHTGMINHHPISKLVTYDEAIQEKELYNLAEGVLRFHQLYKPSYNFETLYIFDAGDNITNDRIYEGQKMEITCQVGAQVMKCLNYQSDFIKKMLAVYPRVVFIQVPGNHGRTTSKPISEEASSSFEYLKGQLLLERFRDNSRVEIIVPNAYTYALEIYKHKYLLTHGNIIRGCTLNSIERAVKDISTLAYHEFYDLIVAGHFHTSLKLTITPETKLLVNGCFIEYDDYAYNKLHKFSTPSQWLFCVSKKSPMHNAQELDLKWDRR